MLANVHICNSRTRLHPPQHVIAFNHQKPQNLIIPFSYMCVRQSSLNNIFPFGSLYFHPFILSMVTCLMSYTVFLLIFIINMFI